jgi:hypothetical protein
VSARSLVAPAAAAALVLATALPAAAQSPPRTVTFREVAKSTTFSYVDNPPRGTAQRPRFSAGDMFVLNVPLINDAGARRGALRATCTVTARTKDPSRAPALCTGVVTLKEGQIVLVVSTTNLDAKVTTGSVVGGTRAYAGARGTFLSTTSRAGTRDTITLLD